MRALKQKGVDQVGNESSRDHFRTDQDPGRLSPIPARRWEGN